VGEAGLPFMGPERRWRGEETAGRPVVGFNSTVSEMKRRERGVDGALFDGENEGGEVPIHFDCAHMREGGQWWHTARRHWPAEQRRQMIQNGPKLGRGQWAQRPASVETKEKQSGLPMVFGPKTRRAAETVFPIFQTNT
jgi:hypothetical protein